MATQAQINAVVATIVAQVPAYSTVSTTVINTAVSNLLNSLDYEVVAAATVTSQLAEKNAIVTKVKQH